MPPKVKGAPQFVGLGGLHGVNNGVDPAKRRLEPLDRSRQQLVWFGPIGFDCRSAGLGVESGHLQLLLRPFSALQRRPGRCRVPASSLPGGGPLFGHQAAVVPSTKHLVTAAAAESWWLTIKEIVRSRCSPESSSRIAAGGCWLSTLRQGIVEHQAAGRPPSGAAEGGRVAAAAR